MKFLHTADLHIGKKIFELSMIEDQRVILNQIYDIACEEQVNAVIIAGDVYDRAVPPTEAVLLLDEFLTKLLHKDIPVILISGNHDSAERVSFADRILEKQGLYIAGTYEENLKTVTLFDEYGPVHFVCLPFVKPGVVGCNTSAEAVEKLISDYFTKRQFIEADRYVLVSHFFVLGDNGEAPELSDSESDVNVGGLDGVPASLMEQFTYTALGHIHKPQRIGGGNVYYSGAPLKYSFGESMHTKSVNIVELGAENVISVRKRELMPLHEMRCIQGKLSDLISREVWECEDVSKEDYLQVTLTDTEELLDPMATLRSVYPNVLQIVLKKHLEQEETEYESRVLFVKKDTAELFSDFYEMLRGESMDEKRREAVTEAALEAERKEFI